MWSGWLNSHCGCWPLPRRRSDLPTEPAILTFADMNYLHTRLTKWIGPKAFGRQWEKFAALDASGLQSFIQTKVAEAMPDAVADGHTCFGFGKYVTHLRLLVPGSWLAALCCSACMCHLAALAARSGQTWTW